MSGSKHGLGSVFLSLMLALSIGLPAFAQGSFFSRLSGTVVDSEGLSIPGATVKVKNGYARNFLVPRKLAIPSGDKTAKMYVTMARQTEIAKDKARKPAEAAAAKYAGVSVEAHARAGEDGTMFGSVTAAEISAPPTPLVVMVWRAMPAKPSSSLTAGMLPMAIAGS